MTASLGIHIFHLYPRHMNLHGDAGNVTVLVSRMRRRGFCVEVTQVDPGDHPDLSQADLLFLGGGQDQGQRAIAAHLFQLGEQIRGLVAKGLPALAVSGGFQLFTRYFRTTDGDELPGISVFDGYTVDGTKRCVGNVVVNAAILFAAYPSQHANPAAPLESYPHTLVGFENHSGLTYLQDETSTLGPVIVGCGNKGDGSGEGAVVNNAIGTYLHGPVLPKNPHLADLLLSTALRHRYGSEIDLEPLDDTVELRAHTVAIERAQATRTARRLRR